MFKFSKDENLIDVLKKSPDAMAELEGGCDYPEIEGKVLFYRTKCGVLVVTEVFGLPYDACKCQERIFAFHIHEGENCCGNEKDHFAGAMGHLNLDDCPHPYHTGDMPPLFGNCGHAFSIFLTDRFFIKDIIGKTVIIHDKPDDFTTQPSGNSGEKIACGVIQCCK